MYGGGGMYGNRMMGMGGAGPYDKFDENGNPMDRLMDGGYSWMMELENLVQGFGRFTQLLDYNFDAVHGSFESIMRLLHSVTELRRAVCYGLQAFAFVALFRKFFRSIYRFVCGLFGIKVAPNVSKSQSMQNAFSAASQQAGRDGSGAFMNGADRNQPHPGASTRSWPKTLLIFCLVFIGAPMLLSSAFSFFFGSRRSSATSAPRLRLARAVADFEGAGPNDLPFRTGDILKILGPTNEPQWLEAQLNGRVGLIPENYIQPVDPRTLSQGTPTSTPSTSAGASSDPSSISDLETEVDHQDHFNDQQQQQQRQQQSNSRQFYDQQQRQQQQQQGFGSYGPPRNTNFPSRFDSPNQFYGEDPFEDRAWNEGY